MNVSVLLWITASNTSERRFATTATGKTVLTVRPVRLNSSSTAAVLRFLLYTFFTIQSYFLSHS